MLALVSELCLLIRRWVIASNMSMLNPMLLHEVMHLLRNKLWAIIRYDLLWKTTCHEKMTEHFDSLIHVGGGRGCRENLWPLRVGIYHHDEVHTVLLCIIHMHTWPNSNRPLSWNQGCSSRLFPSRLTCCTILHDRLNCHWATVLVTSGHE